jgi:hypothetical protein
MKTLHAIGLARLSVLEFGQFMKSTTQNLSLLGAGFITDTNMLGFITSLNSQNANYDLAMLQIAKSDETKKLIQTDKARDQAISAIIRQLSVFELSEADAEYEAFTSLNNLMNTYNGIQKWNYEEETNGIANLHIELTNAKYGGHISTLNMGDLVERLLVKNNEFKNIFDNRMQETASKIVYDVKALRNELQDTYKDLSDYVLVMAKSQNTAQFNESLNVLNAVRKYYYDLLARRTPNNQTPIAPMPA